MQLVQIRPDSELPKSELRVIAALRKFDAPHCLALHSIAWQGIRSNRQGDGEADFVILDGDRGILVLEVKGGGIELLDGAWFSTNARGERNPIKNPFAQARASKHALLKYLMDTQPQIARDASIVHAVAFPDVTCDFAWLGPDSPRAIVIDRADLGDAQAAIARVFDHWNTRHGPDTSQRAILRAAFAPTVTVRRLLCDVVRDTEDELLRLTDEQIKAFDCVRRNRKLITLGGAGTGKTVLAVERARQLSNAGNSTLLVCFNRPLRDRLRRALRGTSVVVETFHSLCTSTFDMAKVEYPAIQDSTWWESKGAEQLVDVWGTRASFDAIVIDEGQDFAESWLDALECLLSSRNDSVYSIYGDAHQTLWQRGWQQWIALRDWPQFELFVNCRNSAPISKQVATVFGDRSDTLGASGADPVFHRLDVRREGVAPLVALVERAIREERLRPSQIAVITSNRDLAQKVQQSMAGDVPFGSLDAPTEDFPIADTIHRFKGLEASFVIAVFGPEVGDGRDASFQELKYVAYSRPTAVLHVFSHKGFAA